VHPENSRAPRPAAAAGDASDLLLELSNISKRFPGVVALEGVDFDLRRGEVHVLFGENGAGKSTLVNIIAGTHPPDTGTFKYQGKDITYLTRMASASSGSARFSRNSAWCRN
jgi:ribose transport system ATP-binding protein